MNHKLRNVPKPPRRFEVIDEETWVGSPSVSYGVVRRLAYEKRRMQMIPYLRVLFGEAGRRGDPWGGLALEINGDLFHFTAGVTRWKHFYNSDSSLTDLGKQALAEGVPGFLKTNCDWRWVQEEVDLTHKLTSQQISQIAEYFVGLREGWLAIPMFQARRWAERNKIAIKPGNENCTTIILGQLNEIGRFQVKECMPLQAIEALSEFAGRPVSPLDYELWEMLGRPESEIQALLKIVAFINQPVDWSAIAKGEMEVPFWLSWDKLKVKNQE